jgi:hypothetical protein
VIILVFSGGNWMFSNIEEKFRDTPDMNTEASNLIKLRKVAFVFQLVPLALALALLFTVAQSFFGIVEKSTISQEGDTFQKYCIRETFVRQFPCRFKGPTTEKVILLLGDSHAAQYSIDIWRVAERKGYELYFAGDFGGEIKSTDPLSEVRALKPDITIISKFWKTNGTKLLPGVEDGIREVKKFSRHTIIIGQNPIYPIDATSSERHTLVSVLNGVRPNLGQKKVWEANLDSQGVIAAKSIRNFAASAQISFIDPTQIFCRLGKCFRWNASGWLYIDNNHLSSLGAKLLIPKIEAEIPENK